MGLEMSVIVPVVLFILAGATSLLAYFYKDLKTKMEADQADLAAYKTHIAVNFVTAAQLKGSIDSLNINIATVAQTVSRIEDKLWMQAQQRPTQV